MLRRPSDAQTLYTFEKSPNYGSGMPPAHIAQLRRLLPSVKLIALVREPVARAYVPPGRRPPPGEPAAAGWVTPFAFYTSALGAAHAHSRIPPVRAAGRCSPVADRLTRARPRTGTPRSPRPVTAAGTRDFSTTARRAGCSRSTPGSRKRRKTLPAAGSGSGSPGGS